jgi:hypothetical protein
MKNISKITFLFLTIALVLGACKKDEYKDYYEGGTAPVLASSVSGSIPLTYATASSEAIKLSWTNPNYQFTTGTSSQNVNYVLEIDTTGANFTNPNKQSVSISQDLSLSILQSQLNDYLLNQLQLQVAVPHNIEMRVKSTLANGSVALISNVLKFTVTPYVIPPKVAVPTSGKLFLVGSATAGGWNNPVPVPSQQFTQVSPTVYTLTVTLTGGQEYLFIPVNGDWSHKYACNKTTLPPNGDSGGDFGYDWNDNFPAPAASGTYKITVDFQRGKFTVTKQ